MNNTQNMFHAALQRGYDFKKLSPETQWEIDKSLGILDWDGNCPCQENGMCSNCRALYNEHVWPLERLNKERK